MPLPTATTFGARYRNTLEDLKNKFEQTQHGISYSLLD